MSQPNNQVFDEAIRKLDKLGFEADAFAALDTITELYKADSIPWVVGYSGGKDSTTVLQLVWMALARMKPEDLTKDVHVITTDTLVENPIVATWVNASLEKLKEAAEKEGLPIFPHLLTPDKSDTFWVNLIGRGYPAPRPKFRWCTMRLKIEPANEFVKQMVAAHGEAIMVLGTRKAESSARAHVMKRMKENSIRDQLRTHSMLPAASVFSPIEDWANDDVWTFLLHVDNPWGYSNQMLLNLYRGASADNECPLVVEQGTPSCGDSRFGCWVCTLVEKDKSMSAMIENDQEKKWMLPLLQLRDELIPRDDDGAPKDRHLRDFRRMHGGVQLMADSDQNIPGPYTQSVRETWLRKLLAAQKHVHEVGPEAMREHELITIEEMREIRRIWVNEKHEIEDSLPRIYEEVIGAKFPDRQFTEDLPISFDEVQVLREICDDDDLHFQLTRELVSIERQHKNMLRRAGIFEEMEKAFSKSFFEDEADATNRAKRLREAIVSEQEVATRDPYIQSINEEPLLPGFNGTDDQAAEVSE